MRRIIPALCAIVMLTAFMVPTLAVADLGQTCPEDYGAGWSCEGLVKDGKRDGNWTFTNADGTVEEGRYKDGEKHGNWVTRQADGTVAEERSYVDGKKHGYWVTRFPDEEGSYVNGKKHGYWVRRIPDYLVGRTLHAWKKAWQLGHTLGRGGES